MFEVKNRMIKISANFSSKQKPENCPCGMDENMEHIYICKLFNKEKLEVEYKQLFNGNLTQQITVFKRFIKSFEEREKQETEMNKTEIPHATAKCEPQSSDIEYCYGFDK